MNIHPYKRNCKRPKEAKHKRVTWLTKETKNEIKQSKTKLTKTQNRTKAKCQLRNKAKRTKQTKMLKKI